MAEEGKKNYFDSLFPEPDSNVLVQKCEGWLIRVKAGYKLAIQRNGGIDVYGAGFAVKFPWQPANLVAVHTLNREFEYKDALKTKDGVTVNASSKIRYKFHANKRPSSVEIVNGQPNADASIQDFVQDIVTTVVKNSDAMFINRAFDIIKDNLPDWFDSDTVEKIEQIFDTILNVYGCDVECVHMCDFNDPQSVIDAENEAKAQDIRNETALKKAKNDFEIGQYDIRLEYLKQRCDYASIYEAAMLYNLSSAQVAEIIKRKVTKDNCTIIEGGSNTDSLMIALMAGFKEYVNSRNGLPNNSSDSASIETDVDDEEKGNAKKLTF